MLSASALRMRMTPFRQFVFMFELTLAIQTFHMIEHIAQVLQKFVFNAPSAHGLIGSFDVEQVHFIFNLFYLGTLIYVTLGWLTYGGQVCKRQKLMGALLVVVTLVQGYHMLEHSAKFVQFLNSGIQGTPGLLGAHFDGVIFHAAMNTIVFLPVLIVFICSGLCASECGECAGVIARARRKLSALMRRSNARRVLE